MTVSVIIPAFNAEKTLERAVRSVAASESAALEIILVDDGSSDRTAEICDGLKEKDSRIRVIHQNNRGLSAARNAGIRIAQGEYIGFVDADDEVHPQMFSRLIETAKTYDADCAGCNFWIVGKKGRTEAILPLEGVFQGDEIDREIVLPMIGKRQKNVDFICCVWNKIYRHDLIRTEGIYFREILRHAEDICFNTEYFAKCGKIVFIKDLLYCYYFDGNGSLSTSLREDELKMLLATYDVEASLYPDYFDGEEERKKAIARFTRQTLVNYAKFRIAGSYYRTAVKLYKDPVVQNAFLYGDIPSQYSLAKHAYKTKRFIWFYLWALYIGLPVYAKFALKRLLRR